MLYQDPNAPKKEFTLPHPFIIFLVLVLAIIGAFELYNRTLISRKDAHRGQVSLEDGLQGEGKIYRNEEYGFEIKIPENWITDIQKGAIYLFYSPNKTVQELTFFSMNPEVQIDGRKEIKRLNINNLEWVVYQIEGNLSYEYQLSRNKDLYVFSVGEAFNIIPILSTFKFISTSTPN